MEFLFQPGAYQQGVPAVLLFVLFAFTGIVLACVQSAPVRRSTEPLGKELTTKLRPLSRKKHQKYRAWQTGNQLDGWNRLVRAEDQRRIVAMRIMKRRQRRVIALAWVLGGVSAVCAFWLAVQFLATFPKASDMTWTDDAISFGWMLAAVALLLGLPAFTMWFLPLLSYQNMPPAWRVLAQSALVDDPYTKGKRAWPRDKGETPIDGKISAGEARRLLYGIEAELVATYSTPSRELIAATIHWEVSTHPRITEVLAAKAQLEDFSFDRVPVSQVYAWLDMVAEVLITRVRNPSSVDAARPIDGGASRKAGRTARSRLSTDEATPLIFVAGLSGAGAFVSVMLGAFYRPIESAVQQVPLLASLAGTVGTALVGAIATLTVSLILRQSSKRVD